MWPSHGRRAARTPSGTATNTPSNNETAHQQQVFQGAQPDALNRSVSAW